MAHDVHMMALPNETQTKVACLTEAENRGTLWLFLGGAP